MHLPNYNFLAPFYNIISKIVFGDSLNRASAMYFEEIKKHDTVLIIGGGNGEILRRLYVVNPSVSVTYCELSSTFIGLANKKNPFPKEQIVFLNQDAFELVDFSYDIIVLPFFLDQFSEEQCILFLKRIQEKSKINQKILFSDMHKKGLSKALLKTMFLFFKVTTKLKNNQLPNFSDAFDKAGWSLVKENLSQNSKAISQVYVVKE